MSLALWLSFAAISALNIITPGPANMNVFTRALQLGYLTVLPLMLGNAMGLAIGGIVSASGVMLVVLHNPVLWFMFKLAGTGWLIWLGGKMIFATKVIQQNEETLPPGPATALFREGLLLAVTNPKALLFYLALFPQVMQPEQSLWLQTYLLTATYCGLSMTSLSGYAVMASMVRTRFLTAQRYRMFSILSGSILIVMAIGMVGISVPESL